MTLVQLLFSFKGRIARGTFWLASLAFAVIIFGPAFFDLGIPDNEVTTYLDIANLAILWPVLAVQTKRWHDLDKSAWWLLLNLIPILGPLWALVENGFFAGTPGDNRYGPNPRQRNSEA